MHIIMKYINTRPWGGPSNHPDVHIRAGHRQRLARVASTTTKGPPQVRVLIYFIMIWINRTHIIM